LASDGVTVKPVELDSSGNLMVNVAAGGGSGGTSSTFGNAFPATGTAIGAISSTNTMAGLNLDASGYLEVNVKAGSGSGLSVQDQATFTAGTSNFVPAGGEYKTVLSTLTSGQQGTVALTAYRGFHTNLRDSSGNEEGIAANPLQVSLANTGANGTAVAVSGTVTANQGSANATPWNDNISQFGGSSVTIGQQLASASIPVILPSATITTLTQPTLQSGSTTAVTQATASSLKATAYLNDGSGNSIGSTGGALNVNISGGNISGFATSANQTNKSQITQIADGSGNIIASNSNALDVYINGSGIAIGGGTQYAEGATTSPATGNVAMGRYTSTTPTLSNGALEGLQLDSSGNLKVNVAVGGSSSSSTSSTITGITSTDMTTIAGGNTATTGEGTQLVSLAGPTGDALDSFGNSLSVSDIRIPNLGQALASTSLPVVLPASQISALTPIANVNATIVNPITFSPNPIPLSGDETTIAGANIATTNDGTQLVSLAGPTGDALDTFGNALLTALTPSQLTTLTPPAAITGYATHTDIIGGSQKSQIVDSGGNIINQTGNALNVYQTNPTTVTLSPTIPVLMNEQQVAGTDRLLASEGVPYTALAGATGDPIDTFGNSISVYDISLPKLGQALNANSLPVVLPQSQITSLTPLTNINAAITNPMTLNPTPVPFSTDKTTIAGANVATTNDGTQLVSLAGATGDALDTYGNTLMVYQPNNGIAQSNSSVITSVTASTSAVVLLNYNASRKSVFIYNDSTSILYLGYCPVSSLSTSTYTVQIAAQGYYEMPVEPVYINVISGIWVSANGSARITEMS